MGLHIKVSELKEERVREREMAIDSCKDQGGEGSVQCRVQMPTTQHTVSAVGTYTAHLQIDMQLHTATHRARAVGWTGAASGCKAGRSLWFLGSACERAMMMDSISQGEPERGRCWAEGEQQEQDQPGTGTGTGTGTERRKQALG